MSEDPIGGDQPPEDDAVEGLVLPFPGPAPAAPAKPQRGGQPGELRDIIPPHLRTWQGIAKALRWHFRRGRHHALYHAVRSPKRLALTAGWALVGVARIAFAQLGWWWVSEQAYLRHEAIAAADSAKWLSLHKHVRAVRLVRGCVLGAEVVALALVAAAVTSYLPVLWIPVGVVAVPLLAWIGRPADKPIVTSAVVPGAVERLTIEGIVRALGALGIAEMNKALREEPDKAIATVDGPMRDGPGWLWRGDLPHGVTAGAVSEKREEFASGLRRQLGCVWPETDDKRHPGALNLYVSDEDMTQGRPARVAAGKARRGRPVQAEQLFAYDPRGRAVTSCSCSPRCSSGRCPGWARRSCCACCCSSARWMCAARSTPST